MTHPHDFYREVARVALAAAGPHRFVLGGGVAWAAHGLVTRPTEDVDLFADVEGAAAAAAADVRAALERAGYRVDEADPDGLGEVFDGFDRDLRDFVVSRGDRQIRLSLARLDRRRSPVVMDFGPVMDVRDLLANKTAALVNRREVRDYIDVAAALDRYPVAELLELAHQVDPALEDVDVRAAGRYLDGLADRRFSRYGLDAARIAEVRRRMSVWPR